MNLLDYNKDVYLTTDVGLVRKANEDNCYGTETPNGFLLVCCDGMGGHVGGAKASKIAVDSIVEYFVKQVHSDIPQALTDALLFANMQILGAVSENPELKGMGTTACVAIFVEDKIWFAHVGDSRIYIFCNNTMQLHRLTKDHSVVQGLIDQGAITEAEAESHPHKNRILKALGIKSDLIPEICAMPIMPANGDILMLCTDGLTGMVNDEVLQHIFAQNIPLHEKGENMITLAKQAGGTDNITLQLANITCSTHQSSVFESKGTVVTQPVPAQNITINDTEEKKVLVVNNKEKKNKMTTIILASILLLLTAIVVIILVRGIEKDDDNNVEEQTATEQVDTPQEDIKSPENDSDKKGGKPAWIDFVKDKEYKKIENITFREDFDNIESIFSKDGNFISGKDFDGIVVFKNKHFSEGKFTITNPINENEPHGFAPNYEIQYNREGNKIN